MTKNLFFYSKTKQEFVNCVEQGLNTYVGLMKKGAKECFVNNVSDREVESWKSNAKAISPLLEKANLPDNVYVCFEYLVPVGGRIDCVLFGKGLDGKKNMVHIELKQWSNKNVSEYYGGRTFSAEIEVGGYQSGTKLTSHPSAQANEYQNHLLNYVAAFEEKNINLTGFAYCYNYDSNGQNNVLCKADFNNVTSRCPLYCKNDKKVFAEKLHELLGGGDGESIMNDIIESEVLPTKRLQDAAKNMFDGKCAEDEFALIGDQLDAYNTILGAIEKTDKKDQKTVVIVKGGPGTGKSVIAMRLVSGLAKTGKFPNVYYSTRSTSLLNGYQEILKNVNYADGNDCAAVDLIKKTMRIKPSKLYPENSIDALIIDEAHRIEKCSNDMNDADKSLQTHLTQIMSMLFVSRVCVCFIDDHQSIKSQEIGTANSIKLAAKNYYERIISENEKYRNVDIPKLSEKISRARQNLLKKQATGDEDKIHDAEKKLRSLENELKCSEEWLNSAIPAIHDVNVLEFNLKDQFRCNGSNNYLDWVDKVIYNEQETQGVKLDKSHYEFDVLDTPQDLYAKVRSLDDYAVYADKWQEQMQGGFTYQALQKDINDRKLTFDTSARLIAGWCWPWVDGQLQDDGDMLHEVNIPEFDFSMPWETKKRPTGDFKYKYAKNADQWCNQNEGVNQIGCIHSMQGWETDYVGVIIGPDMKYDPINDCLISAPGSMNYDLGKKSIKGTEGQTSLIRNIYRVLLTRGKKGCFVFACDPDVRDYLRRHMND